MLQLSWKCGTRLNQHLGSINPHTDSKTVAPRSGQHRIRSFGPHITWNDGADAVGLNQINQNLPKSGPQLILFQWAQSLLVYLVRPWLTSRIGLPKCHHSTQYVGCLRESDKLCYLGTHFGLLWLFERSCRREEDTSINRFFSVCTILIKSWLSASNHIYGDLVFPFSCAVCSRGPVFSDLTFVIHIDWTTIRTSWIWK